MGGCPGIRRKPQYHLTDLDLPTIREIDGPTDSAPIEPGPVEPEVAKMPPAILEVHLGMQPGGQFVAKNERVIAAPTQGDRLAGDEVDGGRKAVAGLDSKSRSHTPVSLRAGPAADHRAGRSPSPGLAATTDG